MKIFKFIASLLLIIVILSLMIWAMVKEKDQICTGISVQIHALGEPKLITKSDILAILKQNQVKWEETKMREIDLAFVHKILAKENYIKEVDKVHFSGSKLQIEITLHNILLEVESKDGRKILLDDQGIILPYSPKVKNDVITAKGFIPNNFQKKETITPAHKELYELFYVASLIKADQEYESWFNKMEITDKQEITLYSPFGKIPVLFGTAQDAENKLKALKFMYSDVLPYMEDGKYTQMDVRFKNRIVATKSKS